MTTKMIEAPVTALTLPQRAAAALGAAEHEKQLLLLVAESKTIAEIKNADARAQCHAAYMKLKTARVAIKNVGKAAREDAQAFSNAVIAEERRLITIAEAEETRLQALRDKWDADREAERQAKIEAERARVAAIRADIAAIQKMAIDAAGRPSIIINAAAEIVSEIFPTEERFGELVPDAIIAIDETLAALNGMYAISLEREQEAERERIAKEAEAARLQAEREELARQRAEVAAKLVQQEREAAIERERIAKEQAAAEAELAAERAEMARQQAERDAQAAAQAKAAREVQEAAQAKLDAELAELDRQRAEMAHQKAEWDAHATAKRAEMDRERAAVVESRRQQEAEEAERVRLQALADQMLADHAEALEMNAVYVAPVAEARPSAPIAAWPFPKKTAPTRPSDNEIIAVLASHYQVDDDTAIEWLLEMDLASAGIRMIAHN